MTKKICKCYCSNKLKSIALLNLNDLDPYKVELNLKATFEYYWANKEKYGLPFKEFPIYKIKDTTEDAINNLNKFYNDGYRIFIGFSTSSQVKAVLEWFNQHPDAYGISPSSTTYSLQIKKIFTEWNQ